MQRERERQKEEPRILWVINIDRNIWRTAVISEGDTTTQFYGKANTRAERNLSFWVKSSSPVTRSVSLIWSDLVWQLPARVLNPRCQGYLSMETQSQRQGRALGERRPLPWWSTKWSRDRRWRGCSSSKSRVEVTCGGNSGVGINRREEVEEPGWSES